MPQYLAHHDSECGFPVADDCQKLSLEGFQSGLSGRTILEKRENLRNASALFDIGLEARFGEADLARLAGDGALELQTTSWAPGTFETFGALQLALKPPFARGSSWPSRAKAALEFVARKLTFAGMPSPKTLALRKDS